MEPSEVTLTIPCYDVGDTLPRVLDAVGRLDPPPKRVLCVDDGSTDDTLDVLRARDGVDVVVHDRNRGLGATMNTAIEHTDTPGFAKIDGDIVVEPDWLERMCETLDESGADFVQGKFDDEITSVADRWRAKHPQPPFPEDPLYNAAINGSNVLGRTDSLREVGGWDERYRRAHDDTDVMQRLMYAGFKVYYTPEIETLHVRTDTITDVLRTAYAYYQDPGTGQLPPDRPTDLVKRIPFVAVRSARGVYIDVRDGDYELAGISFLRFFFHVKWDLEYVVSGRSRGGQGT